MKKFVLPIVLGWICLLALVGCGKKKQEQTGSARRDNAPPGGGTLAIVAGPENKSLEPIVQEFARRNGVSITMTYIGSMEIGHELARGAQCPYDDVWPTASLWIDLFDQGKVARSAESIMRTPVVFAV